MIGGRLDKHDGAADALDKTDLRSAYERGRRDERAGRKRHPVMMTITFALAAVGLALLAIAGLNGSFAIGGQVIDAQLNIAADRAAPAVSEAANAAGQNLREAGQAARVKVGGAG
jgi:hypothetical protein